jgi:hypothetical protein
VSLLRTLFWVGLVLQLGSSIARAEDFCAVTLDVAGFDGKPITSTWIELDDPSGKAVRSETMTGPTLKICDFGFGPHSLRVGTNECLPTTISNLRVVFGAPIHLKVVINGCGWPELMGAACRLFLRGVDSEGNPLPDVDISPSIGTNPAQRTDSYGRYQALMGGSYNLKFSKQGVRASDSPRGVS